MVDRLVRSGRRYWSSIRAGSIQPDRIRAMASLISLGYWLVESDEILGGTGVRPYRGIDRQPHIPGPEDDDRLRSEGQETLVALRNRYWHLDDVGAVRRDPDVALELRNAFLATGITLDVVRADLVELPDLKDVPGDLAAAFDQQLARWSTPAELPRDGRPRTLGIDVTFPFPSFHSAIRQPVLSNVFPQHVAALNPNGLFSDNHFARRMTSLCNRHDTAWRPFCSVRVTQID